MKMQHFVSLIFSSLTLTCPIFSQPTSTFWTNCTTDTLGPGIGRAEVYNYFTVCKGRGKASSFSPDVGYTAGIFSLGEFKLEAGIDYITGVDNAFTFNSKIGIDENKLFSHSPAFSVGIFNIGTKHSSNKDIVDLVIGKSLPDLIGGRLFLGGFYGKKSLGKNRGGFWAGFDHGFFPAKDKDGTDFSKVVLAADFASGKNTIGGGGFGLYYYFTPTISFLTGPVWFNDQKLNGQWKWSVQLYFGERIFSPSALTF